MGYESCFASCDVTLPEGASVYDALVATGVSFDYSSGYVSSINGLAELDGGSMSGWLFQVDGEYPSVGCESYELSGGEQIVWIYIRDWEDL